MNDMPEEVAVPSGLSRGWVSEFRACVLHILSLALGYTLAHVAAHELTEVPEAIQLKDCDGNVVWAGDVMLCRKDNQKPVGMCVAGSTEQIDAAKTYRIGETLAAFISGVPRPK